MAVVHCKEVVDRSGDIDKLSAKRYTRTFQLLTDSRTDGAAIVRDYAGLPDIGDAWESVNEFDVVTDIDVDAFCVEKRATQTNKDCPNDWTVKCEYVGKGDPTLEPAEVDWSCVKYQAAMQRDFYDVWVRNSAGDPFEGGITRDKTRFAVMIRKNVLTWDPAEALEYIDTTNQAIFLFASHFPGFAPGMCKLSDLNASAVWYEDLSGIHYWKRQAKIEISTEGWELKILDAGFRKLVSGATKPIMDTVGAKISSPALLDGSGAVVAPAGNPVWLTFTPYEPKDWTPLALDY